MTIEQLNKQIFYNQTLIDEYERREIAGELVGTDYVDYIRLKNENIDLRRELRALEGTNER